jgi:VCBS repeat-containing protein
VPQVVDLVSGNGDTLVGNGGDDRLYGGLDNDTLIGGDGDDLLYGLAGSDTMAGGAGDDGYVMSGGYEFGFGYQGGDSMTYSDANDRWDTLEEDLDGGTDTVYSEIDFALGNNFENLTLLANTSVFDPDSAISASPQRGGRSFATVGEGNELDNVIIANDFGNELYGDGGNDTLVGGAGSDYLDGGDGADTMTGASGDDSFEVNDAGDLVVEGFGAGIDQVYSSIDYTLTDNVENLNLTGETYTENLSGIGNQLDNVILGNDGDNALSGLAGNDTLDGGYGEDVMNGGIGDDTYYVDNEFDVTTENADEGHDTVYASVDHTLGDNIEDLYLTGFDDIYGEGNELDNLLVGNEGYNYLGGYGGNDILQGWGGGDELYGDDGDDQLAGAEGFDYLEGGDGNDILDGGTEGDEMVGGAGDDTYRVDNYNDSVFEAADEGIDIVFEDLSYYAIGENVENTTVIGEYRDIDRYSSWQVSGNALDNVITGNDGRNDLEGNGGDDIVDGRASDDDIYGGDGSDRLYGGFDALRTDLQFDFVYFGNSEEGKEIFRTISALASNSDYLEGGTGDDRIDAGSGDDDLQGGEGDDFLYGGDDGLTADAADVGGGEEGGSGGGIDSIDDGYGEKVFLTNNDFLDGGAGDDVLDGGSGNDEIHGGDGNDTLYGGNDGPLNRSNRDTLDGGAGIDTMAGGTDDDTYYVDGTYVDTTGTVIDDCGDIITDAPIRVWTTDTVVEFAGQGYDVVYSAADFTLPDNVEELHLLDFTDARFARGNDGDNAIYGNAYDNRLEGAGGDDLIAGGFGDDVLDGGAGNDVLYGEYGNNVYNLGAGYGQDTVISYGGGTDSVHIVGDIPASEVTLTRQGDDVVIGLAGGSDRMVLSNWFNEPIRVQQIVFCDDDPWDESMISDLANSRVDVVEASGDFNEVQEDGTLVATGNVLENDVDFDPNAFPTVAEPASYAGSYGTVELAANGSYIYMLDNGAVQSLAEGETAYEVFGYTAQDNFGAYAGNDLTIQVTGQNDAPVLGPQGSGAVVEDQLVVESFLDDSMLFNGGFESRLNGWNLDGNTEYAGYMFDAYDGNRAGMFGAIGEPTLLSQDVATDGGAQYELDFFLRGGAASDAQFSVSWNGATLYSAANTTYADYTAFHFDVTGVEGDSHLEFSFRNDPNVWYLDEVTLRERAVDEFVPGDQYTSGALNFTDVDASDAHDLSFAARAADYLGFFDAWVDADSGGGNTGVVMWEFDVDNGALQYLAQGESLEQTYDLTVDDGNGGTATQSVTVILYGVNDAPAADDSVAFLQEDDTLVASDNVLSNAFDVDANDVLSIANPGTYVGAYGTLELAVDGSYTYTLDNDSAAVQSLNEGDTVEEAFVYTVSDGIAVVDATLYVDIDGSNDAPVALDDAASVGEDGPLSAADNVLQNDFDVDSNSFLTISNAGTYLGAYGTLELEEDGSYSYALDGAGLQSLAAGQQVQDVFAYDVTDDLATSSANLTVTIDGANDAPVADDVSATVGEDGPAVTITPVYSDVDTGDTHTIAVGAFGNTGFEQGSFAGWMLSDSSLGAIVSDGAPLGASYATLSSGAGQNDYTILSRTFTLAAGETLSGLAEFVAGDALPYDDDGYVAVRQIGGATTLLFNASVTSVGDYGDSGWVPFEFTALGAGTYVLEAGVRNVQDNSADSRLLLDGVEQLRPAAGVTLNPDGTFDYDPGGRFEWLAGGESATDTFSYTVTDNHGAQATATATVEIVGANDAPEIGAADLAATVTEDNAQPAAAVLGADGTIAFNDVDLSDAHEVQVGTMDSGYLGEFTAQIVADSTGGGAGSVQWTFSVDNGALDSLGEGETREQSYEVLVDDGHGSLAERIVAMTLAGVNDAPVAMDETAAVQEDGTLIASGNVLGNDSDVDLNSSLQVSNPGTFVGGFGALTLVADGGYSYALDNAAVQYLAAGQHVTDAFSYAATDGLANSTATLTVDIAGANDAPVTQDDSASVQEDGVLAASGNLLANDSDVDGGTTLTVANAGLYGSLALSTNGNYTYTLDNASAAVQGLHAGEVVTDSFVYLASDGLTSTAGTLAVGVTGANDAPETQVDAASVQEDTALTATGNVLANDSDVDSGTVLNVAAPGTFTGNYGVLTLSSNGSYGYTLANASVAVQSLAAGQTVTDVFGYAATDGIVSTPSTLTVTVTGTNDAPMTVNDAASVKEDVALAATGNVLGNDSDIDANALLNVSAPGAFTGTYGTLEISTDGSYSYTLANGSTAVQALRAGQSVTDVFGYAASDGIASTTGSLVMTVNGTNDNPVANNDTGAAQEDGPAVTLLASMLLANDTDADAGDSKTITTVTNSAAGAQVTLVGGNAVYNVGGLFQILKAGATATDSFSYTMVDAAGEASTATVTMTVTGVNDAPVLVGPIADQNVAAGTAFNLVFAATTFNDIDIGDTLFYSATQADGTALPLWLSFNAAARTFSGTPPGGTGGTDGDCGCGTGGGTATDIVQIRVLATDTAGASASDAFALNISGVTGSSGIVPIVGTDHDDVIAGTSGNDVIDGRKGYDRMMGGAGDDVYYVDETCGRVDLVTEGAVAGYDTVYSSANYSLVSNVEELHLIGSENLEGHGNSLANMVIGNSGDNKLYGEAGNDLLLDDAGDDRLDGGAGDDVLDGGAGNDTLVGGTGNDVFVHGAGGGDDVVQDSGGADAIRFSAGIAAGDVTVRRSSNDLVMRLSGGNGSVTAKDWFASSAKRVEQVQFADGTTWNEAAIRARVTSGDSGSSGGSHDGASSGSGGGYGGDDGHSNDCGNGNHGDGHDGHDDHDGHHGDHEGGEDCGSDEMRDAIAQRLKHNPNYDFTALAQYLQRNGGGGYGAMTPQQIAQRWLQVQNCVGGLAQMGENDCGSGHDGHSGYDGGYGGGDDERSRSGWGYSGSTGQSGDCGGMGTFSGLGEGFRRL